MSDEERKEDFMDLANRYKIVQWLESNMNIRHGEEETEKMITFHGNGEISLKEPADSSWAVNGILTITSSVVRQMPSNLKKIRSLENISIRYICPQTSTVAMPSWWPDTISSSNGYGSIVELYISGSTKSLTGWKFDADPNVNTSAMHVFVQGNDSRDRISIPSMDMSFGRGLMHGVDMECAGKWDGKDAFKGLRGECRGAFWLSIPEIGEAWKPILKNNRRWDPEYGFGSKEDRNDASEDIRNYLKKQMGPAVKGVSLLEPTSGMGNTGTLQNFFSRLTIVL